MPAPVAGGLMSLIPKRALLLWRQLGLGALPKTWPHCQVHRVKASEAALLAAGVIPSN